MINLENKNILITGGLGILGKSLIPELALLKANVIVVDIQDIKNTVGSINEIPPNPNIKPSPGRSNIIMDKRKVPTNNGILQIKKL